MYSAIPNGTKTNGDKSIAFQNGSCKRGVMESESLSESVSVDWHVWHTKRFTHVLGLVKTSTGIRYLASLSGSSSTTAVMSREVQQSEKRGRVKDTGRNRFVRNMFKESLSAFYVTYIKRILRRTSKMKTLIFGLTNKKFIYAGTHRLSPFALCLDTGGTRITRRTDFDMNT